jgi:hypothetical protein
MESVEARSLVRAACEVVWDIITDEGNYPVWDLGITDVAGEMRKRFGDPDQDAGARQEGSSISKLTSTL